MTLLEGLLRETIYIDFGEEIIYGTDCVPINNTIKHFNTVTFSLMSTRALDLIADRIRSRKGLKVMYNYDMPIDECNMNGWYNFYIGVNDAFGSDVDSQIDFVVVSEEAPDNEESYSIDLTRSEQNALYDLLNEQCIKYIGKTFQDLLAESARASAAE